MSSPGGTKGNRPAQPCPEDYDTPVAEMETNHILKSTLTGESRKEKGDTKTCLFCGFRYYFRPIRARDHLGLGSASMKVQQCKPYAQHIERHAQHIERHAQHTERHAQGKMSLGAMFRVNGTRDGCFFEKRWILKQVHQVAGQSNGRYTGCRDVVERALLS